MIKPKFKIGQLVWYEHPLLHKPVAERIKDIVKKPFHEIQYIFPNYAIMEKDILKEARNPARFELDNLF